MDSVTQAVLGASIAGVCAPKGQRRKALAVGAALGTLPDLDVFIDYGDAVRNFTYHRSFSHSLLVLMPFSVLLWFIARRWWEPVREAPSRWFAIITLVLVTHPLLDAHTAYGTQLFWPLTVPPTMWATLFIVDPLYTLPLIFGALFVAFRPEANWSNTMLRAGLALSTVYLGWSWVAQALVERRAQDALTAMGLQHAPVFVTPAPLNTLLWRVVVLTDDGYLEGFHSLVADTGPIAFESFESDRKSLHEAGDLWAVARLRWFSQDFLGARVENEQLLLSDLRMGQEPTYVFTHVVATRGNPHWKPIATELVQMSFEDRAIAKTWERIWNNRIATE